MAKFLSLQQTAGGLRNAQLPRPAEVPSNWHLLRCQAEGRSPASTAASVGVMTADRYHPGFPCDKGIPAFAAVDCCNGSRKQIHPGAGRGEGALLSTAFLSYRAKLAPSAQNRRSFSLFSQGGEGGGI